MIAYWQENSGQMFNLMLEHAQMVLTSLGIAFLVAIVLIVIFLRRRHWLNLLIYVFSLLYSAPSYAFFTLLIPITGLGKTSAIIVLAFYSEYVLLRTFITGIQAVNFEYLEVAKGMGMTQAQIFWHIQLPLALPAIFSGLQVALASTMAIATIASTISAGGLGDLLFTGLQTGRVVPILWGTILTVVLTLICIAVLKMIEALFTADWQSAAKGEQK